MILIAEKLGPTLDGHNTIPLYYKNISYKMLNGSTRKVQQLNWQFKVF